MIANEGCRHARSLMGLSLVVAALCVSVDGSAAPRDGASASRDTAPFSKVGPSRQGSEPLPRPWGFFGGYTSHELGNHGMHVGAEYLLAATTHFSAFTAASFQAYHQPDAETGYALHARWGQRFRSSFGLTFASYVGLGAQDTRYVTPVFEFENAAASARDEGRSVIAFSPHIVLGPGFDFERVLDIPLLVYAHPGVFLLYPDLNDAFQASVIAEFGVLWAAEL